MFTNSTLLCVLTYLLVTPIIMVASFIGTFYAFLIIEDISFLFMAWILPSVTVAYDTSGGDYRTIRISYDLVGTILSYMLHLLTFFVAKGIATYSLVMLHAEVHKPTFLDDYCTPQFASTMRKVYRTITDTVFKYMVVIFTIVMYITIAFCWTNWTLITDVSVIGRYDLLNCYDVVDLFL